MNKREVPMSEAHAAIAEAVERLLQLPRASRPFVIVEVVRAEEVFVQFCGSEDEQLVFDVPQLAYQSRFECMATGAEDPSYEERLCYIARAGATAAIRTLREDMHVPLESSLRIIEDTGEPAREIVDRRQN